MPHSLRIVSELTAVRKAAQLQQSEVAKRANVSRMTFSRIESGHNPRLWRFHEISRALDMELHQVPQGLRAEVQLFIQSGGKVLGRPPGVEAPLSAVNLLGR